MRNIITLFATGLSTAAVLLITSSASAQNVGFAPTALRPMATETASISSLDASATGDATVHNLSAADKATDPVHYDDSHKDLQQALAWTQETNALHPEYWSVYAEARIRLQLKDYTGALAMAAEAKKLALAAANPDYARRSEEVLAQAKARTK